MENNVLTATATVITSNELLEHWQGHRRLTRKVIAAFPEDKLFHYSIGGMRPFSALAMELLGIASPGVHGLATGEWTTMQALLQHTGLTSPANKEELLQLWDITTVQINDIWPRIAPDTFPKKVKAFDQYEGTGISSIFYFIDNEIHHRGQGYVYLRSLGIEPPYFWDRN